MLLHGGSTSDGVFVIPSILTRFPAPLAEIQPQTWQSIHQVLQMAVNTHCWTSCLTSHLIRLFPYFFRAWLSNTVHLLWIVFRPVTSSFILHFSSFLENYESLENYCSKLLKKIIKQSLVPWKQIIEKWGAAQDFCISLYLSCGIFRSTKKPDSVFGRKKEVLEIHCKETLD